MTLSTLHERKPPPLLHLAARIHEQILLRHSRSTEALQYLLGNLHDRLEQLASIRRRLALCQERGFPLARVRVLEELQYVLRNLPSEVSQAEQRIPQERPVLPLGEVARELEQLEEEFGGWTYDHEESALVVITEPIVLQDMALGPFEIRLLLDQLGRNTSGPAYSVVALEPNHPASNDSITHPHVQDNHLCEGEAAAAIRGALAEGRICDMFVLVRSVLQTYNSESPYLSLSDWYGHPCHDCGHVVDDDDRYYCEGCDHDFCESCSSYCTSCDRSLCLGCLEECSICEDRTCSGCLKNCDECGKSCCPTCLKNGPCLDCHENKQEKEKAHDDDQSAAAGESGAGITIPANAETLTTGQAA